MKALMCIIAVGAIYWLDANWNHGQFYLAFSTMLRDILQHAAAAV